MTHRDIRCTTVSQHNSIWNTKHEQTPPSYGHNQAVQVEAFYFDINETVWIRVISNYNVGGECCTVSGNESLTSDGVRVKAAPERKDVQLVEFGDFLQEGLAVWAQSRVEHRLSSPELEVENALVEMTK